MSTATDRFFVDTNALLRAVDASDAAKHVRAGQWMDDLCIADSGRLSWQVLNEFDRNAAGNRKTPAARAQAPALSEDFQAGQRFDDLTVLDPFHSAPEEFLG